MRIISVFEWGLQPLTAATAGGYLERHVPVSVDDVFVDAFQAVRYQEAWLVAIAGPVYDAIAGAITIARDIESPDPHRLFRPICDGTISGTRSKVWRLRDLRGLGSHSQR